MMPQRSFQSDPEAWVQTLFKSKAAIEGRVIRRSLRDIDRFASRAVLLNEINRRGYRAVENAGQIVIFCNQEPIHRVA